jgi:Ca2+/H+ antiporter
VRVGREHLTTPVPRPDAGTAEFPHRDHADPGFAPLLITAVVTAVLITSLIVFDRESNWLEGAILVALYAIIATQFWWG